MINLLIILILISSTGFIFGIIYPLLTIITYKISGSKKSIREIINEV